MATTITLSHESLFKENDALEGFNDDNVRSFVHFSIVSSNVTACLFLVFCMGNPWVILTIPVPIPAKTHTRAAGMGNYRG